MSKMKFPAAALLLVMLIGIAPLTASAPLSASAAAVSASPTATIKTIKVQNMNVKMVFDGVSLLPPEGQYVFIHNNTTYVPLRFMSYALQKSVNWDAKKVKVTVAEPSSAELVVIKEYLMNASNGNTVATKSIALNNVVASYEFNGTAKSVPTGQGSYMLNGSLYVPLRFLSESVGNNIVWDQKSKTITAASKAYVDQTNGNSTNPGQGNSGSGNQAGTATPAPTNSSGSAGSGAGTGTVTYESITSATEGKLNALRAQSQSTLIGIALEYVAAKDDASKQSIMAKGKSQLASFTASFNSIVADAEQKLKANGYSTDIINQYRSTFEAELQAGLALAEGMGN